MIHFQATLATQRPDNLVIAIQINRGFRTDIQ